MQCAMEEEFSSIINNYPDQVIQSVGYLISVLYLVYYKIINLYLGFWFVS